MFQIRHRYNNYIYYVKEDERNPADRLPEIEVCPAVPRHGCENNGVGDVKLFETKPYLVKRDVACKSLI